MSVQKFVSSSFVRQLFNSAVVLTILSGNAYAAGPMCADVLKQEIHSSWQLRVLLDNNKSIEALVKSITGTGQQTDVNIETLPTTLAAAINNPELFQTDAWPDTMEYVEAAKTLRSRLLAFDRGLSVLRAQKKMTDDRYLAIGNRLFSDVKSSIYDLEIGVVEPAMQVSEGDPSSPANSGGLEAPMTSPQVAAKIPEATAPQALTKESVDIEIGLETAMSHVRTAPIKALMELYHVWNASIKLYHKQGYIHDEMKLVKTTNEAFENYKDKFRGRSDFIKNFDELKKIYQMFNSSPEFRNYIIRNLPKGDSQQVAFINFLTILEGQFGNRG